MNIITSIINLTKTFMENTIEDKESTSYGSVNEYIKYNNILFYKKLFKSYNSIIYTDIDEKYILKKYTPLRTKRKQAEYEINILQELSKHNNDNIVGFISSLSETVNNKITYSLLFNRFGEDLFEHINKNVVSIQLLNTVINELMKTVSFLHSINIAHCDIKCENILIKNGSIKLCDFGFATYMDNNHNIYDIRGTIDYISPSLYINKVADGRLNDLWSIGVVICMVVYNTPFNKAKQYMKSSHHIEAEIILKDLLRDDAKNFEFIFEYG